ncbi:chitin deacetylase family protein [Altericista sp. CCNU0014]|uniref:chitin deacetylase family protein n=1 Tax=Altericista sp. CCNU0014 TaxID=3082949 RepID=UPI00384E3E74
MSNLVKTTTVQKQKQMLPIVFMLLAAGGLTSLLWLQPRWLWTQLSPWLCPGATFFVETEAPMVALTVDDGPDDTDTHNANTTRQILQVLKKYDAHATFFLIGGRITAKNQSLIAEMVEQGNEVGNHLWADEPSISLPLSTFESELLETQRSILEAAQTRDKPVRINWLRPGSGMANRDMMKVARKYGYRVALGSIWPYDTLIPSSRFASTQILGNVRPGAIVILHDRGDNGEWGKRTVKTLEQVLPELQRRGLKVVTLSKLLEQKPSRS